MCNSIYWGINITLRIIANLQYGKGMKVESYITQRYHWVINKLEEQTGFC